MTSKVGDGTPTSWSEQFENRRDFAEICFLFFLAVGEYSSQNYHIPPLEKENHLQSRVLGRDM